MEVLADLEARVEASRLSLLRPVEQVVRMELLEHAGITDLRHARSVHPTDDWPMRLDRFGSVDDWLAVAGGFLAEREAQHNLMLGLGSNLRRNPETYDAPPYLAAVRDAERVVAAALRTPPYNLILSEIDDLGALEMLVDDLRGERLPGVVGPPEPVAAFAEQWVTAVGGSWAVALEERIYRLAQVKEPAPAPGGARLALAADRDLLERWLIEFGIEALNDADAERVRFGLDDWERNGGRRYWIWEVDGRP